MMYQGISRTVLQVPFWSILVFAFELATGWIRSIDLEVDNAVMLVKYFVLTLVILRYWKTHFSIYFIIANIFLGIFLFVFFYENIVDSTLSIVGWPNIIMGLLGLWSAYLFYRIRNKTARAAIAGIPILLLILTYYKMDHIRQFNNYRTFTFITNQYVDPDQYSLTDESKGEVRLEQDVIYVLDFWYTGCGVCFTEFPHFNEMLLKNKNPRIRFVSVNWPIPSDEENQAFEMLEKYDYAFPVWKGSEEINKAFGVEVYPTIVVLRNDTILYKGNLGLLDEFLDRYEEADP